MREVYRYHCWEGTVYRYHCCEGTVYRYHCCEGTDWRAERIARLHREWKQRFSPTDQVLGEAPAPGRHRHHARFAEPRTGINEVKALCTRLSTLQSFWVGRLKGERCALTCVNVRWDCKANVDSVPPPPGESRNIDCPIVERTVRS